MPMHDDPDLRNPEWHDRAYERAIARQEREARAEETRREAIAEEWRERVAIAEYAPVLAWAVEGPHITTVDYWTGEWGVDDEPDAWDAATEAAEHWIKTRWASLCLPR